MYGHLDSNHALMLRRRVAYCIKEIIRFSDDLYDRIWVPAINGGDFTVLTSDESLIEVSLDDNPPRAVFQNAFATNSTSISITLGTNLPTTEVPIHMNMYFSEVSVLDSTQKRSFELYIDGNPSSNPFTPVYGKAGEMYLGSFGLFGYLPDLTSMTALEIIDLHNNSLIGPIPEFLGTLPNLKRLNLADNEFSGPIPSSKSKNTKLKSVADPSGNSPAFSSSSGKKKRKLPVILGTTIPIFVLLWVIGGVFAVLHHKRKSVAIAAGNAGQTIGANRHNGTPPLAAKMQMAANNTAQNLVNDFK
ncbi:hypothetical protein CRYUN_Cryun25bG0111300 [Craigia yunnanensis]